MGFWVGWNLSLSLVNDNNEVIYLKDTGTNLTEEHGDLVTSLKFDETKFKYFTSEDLKEILDIFGVEQDVLIDFTNKIVVSANGIEIDGEKYHMLENSVYYPTYDENKNKPVLDTLSYTVTNYGTNKYKITVTPNYSTSNTAEGYVKYKKTTTKYWETSNNLEIIIEELGTYDIIYQDVYENSITKKVTVAVDIYNNLIATEIAQ